MHKTEYVPPSLKSCLHRGSTTVSLETHPLYSSDTVGIYNIKSGYLKRSPYKTLKRFCISNLRNVERASYSVVQFIIYLLPLPRSNLASGR